MKTAGLRPGQKVRVRQSIHMRGEPWETEVDGEIVSVRVRPTGSWFAHGKDDRLWLSRLQLRRPDGELIELNLDRHSVVTILPDV